MESEEFEHPKICGQFKQNYKDNSIHYVDGDDCKTKISKVNSKMMKISIKLDKDLHSPWDTLQKMTQRIAA